MTSTRVKQAEASVLGRPADGYSDCFVIAAPPVIHLAREWAVAALAGSEASGGLFSRLVWGRVLGFELVPRDDINATTLYGWRVLIDGPDEFVMAADGSRMAGHMTFTMADEEIRWMTALDFHGAAGRRIWRFVGTGHRALVPRCLARARRQLTG